MSAQINLYHERFRKQRDYLNLANIAGAASLVLLALLIAGFLAWQRADLKKAEATAASAEFKKVREQLDAVIKVNAEKKSDPRLATEVMQAEALLARREEIARLLEAGAIGNTHGFAENLRAFARQTPAGVWLTGFHIGAGGHDIEIHGRMQDPTMLPDYIRRLGKEEVFQGRHFAALDISHADVTANVTTNGTAVSPAPTSHASALSLPPHFAFTLIPRATTNAAGEKVGKL